MNDEAARQGRPDHYRDRPHRVAAESAPAFDLDAHRAEKMRRLERENEHLRAIRAQLERLLAQALRMATSRSSLSPLMLLAVLEEVDARVSEPPIEKAVRVLRETA